MKFLYDVGGEEEFIHCPVCGRREFGYDSVDYPTTRIRCLSCGAVTEFKKSIRTVSGDQYGSGVQSK